MLGILISFIVSVAANVVADVIVYFIRNWLDRRLD